MPSGEVHAGIGYVVGSMAVVEFTPPSSRVIAFTAVASVGIGILGALLPDVDSMYSTVGRYVPRLPRLRLEGWRLVLRERGLLSMMGVKHRGITHRLRCVPLVGVLAGVIAHHWIAVDPAIALGAAMALGYLSHLVADRPLRFWQQV